VNNCCVEGAVDASIGLDGAHAGPSARRRPFTMTRARGAIGVATAVLLLVATTSCSDDDSDPARTPPPATSTGSAPATTTTPPSESNLASSSAAAVTRRYYLTVDDLSQHPSAPLAPLTRVAISTQLSATQTLLGTQRKKGETQTGETRIAKLVVGSVNLDNSEPESGNVPMVEIDVCWDVTDVDVTDADGKSIVSPTRPNSGWTRLTVANYQYATDPTGGWRVASGRDLEQTPCVAS
jgi:hypothetical protein